MKNQTINVSAGNMAALDRIAAECGIVSERGPAAGQPSGRALVRAIAEGRVKCNPNPKQSTPRTARNPLRGSA